jgi:hypothetical protein
VLDSPDVRIAAVWWRHYPRVSRLTQLVAPFLFPRRPDNQKAALFAGADIPSRLLFPKLSDSPISISALTCKPSQRSDQSSERPLARSEPQEGRPERRALSGQTDRAAHWKRGPPLAQWRRPRTHTPPAPAHSHPPPHSHPPLLRTLRPQQISAASAAFAVRKPLGRTRANLVEQREHDRSRTNRKRAGGRARFEELRSS